MARRHRITAGNMYDTDGPVIEEGADGALTRVDWTAYDAAHDKVLNLRDNIFGPGAAPIEAWRVPLSTGVDGKPRPSGRAAWDAMVAEIVHHWRERGWNLAQAYAYLADEPGRESLNAVSDFARRVKVASGGALQRQVAVYTVLGERWELQPPLIARWADLIDRWLVAGDYYDPRQLSALPPGTQKGMYQGGEPYQGNETLDADGVALRTWSWIAWQYRMDFVCYYSMAEAWRKAVPDPSRPGRFIVPLGRAGENNDNEIWDHPRNRPWALSQGVFIYPGRRVRYDRPIVNIRLKQIRRGQTDFEYFWLLRLAGEGALADRLVKRVLNVAVAEAAPRPASYRTGQWSHDPDDWDAAIDEAGRRLEALAARLPSEPPARAGAW
jgi:hypothetical protein